jgi:hypothetical protein
MEEPSGSFLALQFTLTFLNLLDSLSMLKYLLGGSIANAERAWLSLRVFEGSPAVSSDLVSRVIRRGAPTMHDVSRVGQNPNMST